MNGSRPNFIAKQISRCRRFLAILPSMMSSPYTLAVASREMGRATLFHGFEGFKEFCRTWESCRTTANHHRLPAPRKETRGYLLLAQPYVPNSAGVGCSYRLCHELNVRGYPSFMVDTYRTAPQWTAPLISWKEGRRLARQGYIAVYPENVVGNPLAATTVARWVLNRPGLLGGRPMYDDSELIFNYSDVYKAYIHNAIAGKLYMPTIDQSIFFCEDDNLSRRTLECFYVGKSTWKDGVIDRNKTFEITRRSPSKSELGKLFRASRVLYCFDNSTILIYEALLCGCPVVVIPDGTQTRSDYEKLELGAEGIAWGMEERDRVRVDVQRLQRRYQAIEEEFLVQLAQFIAITQQTAHPAAKRTAA